MVASSTDWSTLKNYAKVSEINSLLAIFVAREGVLQLYNCYCFSTRASLVDTLGVWCQAEGGSSEPYKLS